MANKPEYIIGLVDDNGKFIPTDPEHFLFAFRRHCGHLVKFCLTRWYPKASESQRGYYFGILCPLLGDYIGEDDVDAVHAMLKAELNYEIIVGADGHEVRKILETKHFDTVEEMEYIEKCRRFIERFCGIPTPDPDPTKGKNWLLNKPKKPNKAHELKKQIIARNPGIALQITSGGRPVNQFNSQEEMR